jgi:hypothetical protein
MPAALPYFVIAAFYECTEPAASKGVCDVVIFHGRTASPCPAIAEVVMD